MAGLTIEDFAGAGECHHEASAITFAYRNLFPVQHRHRTGLPPAVAAVDLPRPEVLVETALQRLPDVRLADEVAGDRGVGEVQLHEPDVEQDLRHEGVPVPERVGSARGGVAVRLDAQV